MMNKIIFDYPHWVITIITFVMITILSLAESSLSYLHGKKNYSKMDSFSNFLMYVGSLIINAFWIKIVFNLSTGVHEHSLLKLGQQWWLFEGETHPWEWLLLFLLDDLCFYIFHRSSHSTRLLWASHVNHHSSQKFNFTTALRQTWTPFLAAFFWLPLAIIGFDPLMILTMQALSLFYQSLLHTELPIKLGFLEKILNTPSHHRVHHGKNKPHVNKNFGGVLIIWDRLFGSFQKQVGIVEYGINKGNPGHNIFSIAFHEWISLFKELHKKGE